MRTITHALLAMAFCWSSLLVAQTAKERRDSTMNDIRAKHLVGQFERSLVLNNNEVKERIKKSKARREAVLWCIDNSDLKEKQKDRLKKALDKCTVQPQLKLFIAEHKDEIEEYLKGASG